MVAGGKANSGSISKMPGYVLLLLAGEASERQTAGTGGVVHPLTIKASSDSIPKMEGCVLLLLAGKVTSKLQWWEAWFAP